jgi:hypothetical protein
MTPGWSSSGTKLVAGILIRRRLKCRRAGTHTIRHCQNCGVHA